MAGQTCLVLATGMKWEDKNEKMSILQWRGRVKMQLKSIAYNIKSGSNTVEWYSGELSEDYNTFRSSEPPLPEYYAILWEIGRKIWNDYL